MQDYARAMRQPMPPGMAQYRPRYMPPMPPMHNPAEPPGYYEEPRYPMPSRMAYPRPVPEYGPGYNGGYPNQAYPSVRPPPSPVLYQLDPGAMPYIPARYVPPPPGNLRPDPKKPPSIYVNPAGPNPAVNSNILGNTNVNINAKPGGNKEIA